MSLPARNPRLLDLDSLKKLIAEGAVDTVVIAFTDMQGRLQGKRLHASYFVDVVLGFAAIYWAVSARKWFTGPKVQGSAAELAAIENELESLA